MTKARSIAVEKMKPWVAEMVEQKLLELLGDPDAGLHLSQNARKRVMEKVDKANLVPAKTAAARLVLRWG